MYTCDASNVRDRFNMELYMFVNILGLVTGMQSSVVTVEVHLKHVTIRRFTNDMEWNHEITIGFIKVLLSVMKSTKPYCC